MDQKNVNTDEEEPTAVPAGSGVVASGLGLKQRKPRKTKTVRSRTVRPRRTGTYKPKKDAPNEEIEEQRWNTDTTDTDNSSSLDSQDEEENSQADDDGHTTPKCSQEEKELRIASSSKEEAQVDVDLSLEQPYERYRSKGSAAEKAVSYHQGDKSVSSQCEIPQGSETGSVNENESLLSKKEPYQPPDNNLIKRLLGLVEPLLYSNWTAVADSQSIHLLKMSPSHYLAIQREIIVHFNGENVEMAVHCKPLDKSIQEKICEGLPESINLTEETLNKFAMRCVLLSRNMKQFQICLGANHLETFSLWPRIENASIDSNPYFETEYVVTCRADSCLGVVEQGKKNLRCEACTKIIKTLRERHEFNQKEEINPATANKYLSLTQALDKMKKLHQENRRKDKRIDYLEKKVKHALESNGIEVEEEVSLDLSEILCNSNLSPLQELFLRQQFEQASRKDARGHRWHPAIIRLALHIKMVSTAGYEALRDSGFIKLPCSRTLFNYTHYIKPQEGISNDLIQMVKKEKAKRGGEKYQDYFALLVDEMYVSKNLVYRKADGKLVGYTHLDEADKEVAELESRFNNAAAIASEGEAAPIPKPETVLATKVLAFMIKGLCSSIKCVVATFPCAEMNKDMLYTRSWNVISRLESSGIKVLCYVCDGNSINRGFINMHVPLTTEHKIVFDTVNFCSPERRPLYFVSDVSHLLKTIRNCFHNSGREEKKTRCMQLNGEFIEWKSIVRLYQTYKTRTFRKSYKLNPQNVFINSFSSMKVKFAAQVLSETVSMDIKKQNWPGTGETVKFLHMMNKFFDVLNGAHSMQWIKTRNYDLKPYEDPEDARFDWLRNDFLRDYLMDWKKKSEALGLTPKELEKTMLAQPTLEGIEITVRSIEACTKFLLEQGAKFVMARAYSQDPLEQHFSRQRGGFGGSTNPNVSQVQQRTVALGLQSHLRWKRRGANTEDVDETLENLSEPLPKIAKRKK